MLVLSDQTYTIKDCDSEIDVRLGYGVYAENDSLAVLLFCQSDMLSADNESEFDDIYGVITVNLNDSSTLDYNEQFVDENNYPEIGSWLEKNKLAKRTGRQEKNGYSVYNVYKFDLPKGYVAKISMENKQL